LRGSVFDVEKAGCALEVPGSVEPNVPRLFDAANFLIVVKHINLQIDNELKNTSGQVRTAKLFSFPRANA
jgi:hypothetical protein